jgi:cytochrome c
MLGKYLENPKAVALQGKMAFPGLRDDADRKDVIAYLKSLSKP